MCTADQAGELVEGDGVLLGDQAKQLLIAFRDLKAAPVPPCSPPASFPIRERLCWQCRLLPEQIAWTSIWFVCCVLPLPLALLAVCFAPVVRDHPHTGSPKVRVGGHERDAAGGANGAERKTRW
jgi:hypothetical protein